MARKQNVDTTLGDLIVALTDQAKPLARNKRELYGLVSVMLSDMLTVSGGQSGAAENRWFANEAA